MSVHNKSTILPFAHIRFVHILYMFTSRISDLVYQLLIWFVWRYAAKLDSLVISVSVLISCPFFFFILFMASGKTALAILVLQFPIFAMLSIFAYGINYYIFVHLHVWKLWIHICLHVHVHVYVQLDSARTLLKKSLAWHLGSHIKHHIQL